MPARKTNGEDRAVSPSSTAFGSVADDGHRMAGHQPYSDGDDAAEDTSLLGAGAAEEPLPRERTDSWVGWQDFQDIPPWRRPSVSCSIVIP